MSAPVHTLSMEHTLQDAALLMSRHGVRHLPVTEQGRLANIVSERDLFALQRLSLKQVSTQIRAAPDQAALRHLARQIRKFARNLLGQGVHARQLTELISHLNDLLTERLLQLVAAQRGMDLARACWLSFGSEGRSEQTVATDQDNGLVFESDTPDADRPSWLALAREVNEALDACGYPLCKGNVMASNPACCLTLAEWRQRFAHWIEHGAPDDLLSASICFDLRALAGNALLAQPLREMLLREPPAVPRFLKQMADNALRSRPPLNWRGALETHDVDGRAWLDLKLQGTAMFVDAARLYALAHGLQALGTRARLEAAAPLMRVAPQESEAWITGFEFLQMLRLQVQVSENPVDPPQTANPNLIDVAALNDIDHRMLKETMRIARRLQQRIELDYRR
jgi:CBS domain-containing protein